MLQFRDEVARTATKGTAWKWHSRGRHLPLFWDEHSTAVQRLHNYLCLVFGAMPHTFKDFVDSGVLPKARARNCAREYEQVKLAFGTTILPHIDQAVMEQVRARKWLWPDDGE
jgi:Putative metallopeptidase